MTNLDGSHVDVLMISPLAEQLLEVERLMTAMMKRQAVSRPEQLMATNWRNSRRPRSAEFLSTAHRLSRV